MTLTYANPADSSEAAEQLTLTYYTTGPNTGLVQSVTDGTGNTWSYKYDSADRLTSVISPGTGPSGDPGTLTTAYTYVTGSNPEAANGLLSITSPDGSQQNFSYDPATGRLTGTSQLGGSLTNQASITYVYLGQAEVMATNAVGDQTTVWYNDLGLPSRVEDPRSGISGYLYDQNGNLTGYTDAAGDTYQYTYDGNGNLTQIVNPLGQTVQMSYDSLSDLTSITDAENNTTQYGYSSTGNLMSITYPDGTQQSFTYDPLGNPSETVLQNGDPINYQYNAQGLVKLETFADRSQEVFGYDPQGDLTSAKTYDAGGNLTGTTTLEYNAANELTSISYPGGLSLTFTYDPATGQRKQSEDQSGYTISYSYDTLGRLSELTDGSGNRIVQYSYNNLGQLAEKQNGNGTYTTYKYDAAGNLTLEVNYADSSGTAVNSSFTYTYNALNEQTKVTDNAGNATTYGYDATGQLTRVMMPGGQTITYVYNAAGDRTEVINNGTPTAYSSNADNEITQVGSATYTYDLNGNLHAVTDSDGTATYTYNDLNQLVSIAAPDGSTTKFQYSPLGFLMGTSTTTGTSTSQTNELVDPTGLGNVVASFNGSGSLIANYTYGLGLVSQTGPGGTGYYDFDASGNTVGITGASGTYVNQYSYLPFGEMTTVSATLPDSLTFAGQVGVMQIASNLYYMRARDYTPATGQYMSNDPSGLAGWDTNVRRYVGNEPVSFTDPTGLQAWQDTATSPDDPSTIIYSQPIPAVNGEDDLPAGFPPLPLRLDLPVTDQGQAQPPQAPQPQPQQAQPTPQQDPGSFQTGSPATGGHSATGVPIPTKLAPARPGNWHDPNFLDFLQPPSVTATQIAVGFAFGVLGLDPNALVGPAGYGTQSFIQSTGNLPYRIDFENDGSAAAQDVTVTEQLDPNLNWSTFQLGSLGFGPINVTIPGGLAQYETTVASQNTDGSSLNVQVALDFNVQTGLLTVTFTSLDPGTGQAPAGVFDGFLPPDDKNGIGEGYVQYTVQPKSSLTTGTTITQLASVVFDINAPIETNSAVNTIDATSPSSTVAALPKTTTNSSFTVSWSGSDGQGPGIASYSVFVSDNGAAYKPFVTDTTKTSALFTGQVGHTYAFYSLAIDAVGLVQTTPQSVPATTKIVAPPLVTLKQVEDITNKKHQVTEVLVTFSGPVNSTEADQLGTYRLATPGKGGSYTAKNARVIKLSSAVYTGAKDTVALTPGKPFALTKPVQLLVYGTGPTALKDSDGRVIDGDHNGVAGGNALAILSKSGATITALPLAGPSGPAARLAAVDAVIEREDLAARRMTSTARILRT